MKQFKIENEIFFMNNNKIVKKKIEGISTYKGKIKELHFDKELEPEQEIVMYHCGSYTSIESGKAFSTLEELQKSLVDHIEK